MLQPVAHALLGAQEEIRAVLAGLAEPDLWTRPEGCASIGWHLSHLSGSTDRLFTYARGEALTEAQRTDLAAERDASTRVAAQELLARFHRVVDQALAQLRGTSPETVTDFRAVGGAQLPSTVIGLLMHAGEHAARHAGQIKTTSLLVTAGAALDMVTLVVRDHDEAVAFFTGKLGFALLEDTYQPEQDKRWVVVKPPGPASRILLARANTDSQRAAIGNQTGGRVGFFLHTDDFWRDFRAYSDAGVEFVRAPAVQSYGTVAVFADLYGNLWDLIGPTLGETPPTP